MRELGRQMEEQKARREREEKEEGRDWWEARAPPAAEYAGPHPNQVAGGN